MKIYTNGKDFGAEITYVISYSVKKHGYAIKKYPKSHPYYIFFWSCLSCNIESKILNKFGIYILPYKNNYKFLFEIERNTTEQEYWT